MSSTSSKALEDHRRKRRWWQNLFLKEKKTHHNIKASQEYSGEENRVYSKLQSTGNIQEQDLYLKSLHSSAIRFFRHMKPRWSSIRMMGRGKSEEEKKRFIIQYIHKTRSNWRWLQWRPGKASPDFRTPLTAKHFQPLKTMVRILLIYLNTFGSIENRDKVALVLEQ